MRTQKRIAAIVLAISAGALSAQGQEATRPTRQKRDPTIPHRMERTYEIVEAQPASSKGGEAEQNKVGRALESTLVIVDEAARDKSFHRFLIAFDDGLTAAVYAIGDFSGKNTLIEWLVVDAANSEWVLLRSEIEAEEEGYAAAKRAIAGGGTPEFIGFETPRLRINLENAEHFPGTNLPEVFALAEPELVKFIQELRGRLGVSSGLPGLASILDGIAEMLVLKPVEDAGYSAVAVDRPAFSADEPERAKPLAPDFEASFGKWATWRELPRIGD